MTGGVAIAIEKEVRDDSQKLIDSYLYKPFDEMAIAHVLKAVVVSMAKDRITS